MIALSGSSPLTRGKQLLRRLRVRDCRLIPAHAGKTPSHSIAWARRSAHPRSRGENLQFLHHACAMSGSSPLALGKLEGVHADLPDVRLIPAYTGKTPHWSRWTKSGRAHPRSREENDSRPRRAVIQVGSSPLTRGKRHAVRARSDPRGLIPAHAGKTALRVHPPRGFRAHPRSRGENMFAAMWMWSPPGSSPLTRGKPCGEGAPCVPEGFIPAHAGKTRRLARRSGR